MALSVLDHDILERRVRGLVDDALIAEHRQRPFGPHSPELIEVLDFLRRNPDPERPRYVVLATADAFAVGHRGRPPGAPATLDGDDRYPTREAAEHAVFLRRLNDYGIPA
jgi:hypothetical protein